MRNVFTVVIAGGLALFCCAAAGRAQTSSHTSADSGLAMYYFHRTGRCHACLEIERLTRKTADEFKEENPLDRFKLEVKNLDEADNEHFIEEFQVSFNTVVIAEIRDGRTAGWTNLNDQVWALYSDERGFVDSVKEELRKRRTDNPE